ncbi:hypothetical protein L9F63_011038, partial [Diploptera punctata]
CRMLDKIMTLLSGGQRYKEDLNSFKTGVSGIKVHLPTESIHTSGNICAGKVAYEFQQLLSHEQISERLDMRCD